YNYKNSDGKTITEMSAEEKMHQGRIAIHALAEYTKAKEIRNDSIASAQLSLLKENFRYFGYGYLNDPKDIIPNVPMTFYSFHIMVSLGFFFILLFSVFLFFAMRNKIEKRKWWLRIAIISIPLSYFASQAGWIVSELGRQPWVIQDLMPTVAAVSRIDASFVKITFWLFAVVFSVLFIAELKIMFKQIKLGPKDGGQ
ncbi:MAG: cytochrome ubiquinol oxidase subunit I, partial [Bacteroidota bacterium]